MNNTVSAQNGWMQPVGNAGNQIQTNKATPAVPVNVTNNNQNPVSTVDNSQLIELYVMTELVELVSGLVVEARIPDNPNSNLRKFVEIQNAYILPAGSDPTPFIVRVGGGSPQRMIYPGGSYTYSFVGKKHITISMTGNVNVVISEGY